MWKRLIFAVLCLSMASFLAVGTVGCKGKKKDTAKKEEGKKDGMEGMFELAEIDDIELMPGKSMEVPLSAKRDKYDDEAMIMVEFEPEDGGLMAEKGKFDKMSKESKIKIMAGPKAKVATHKVTVKVKAGKAKGTHERTFSVMVKAPKKEPEKKEPEKKIPEKKEPEKKTPEKKEPEKKTPEKKEPEKKSPEKKEPEKKES